MNRKIALLFPLVLAMGPALLAQSANQVTTPSTWKEDIAASDFGGGPAPKSATIHVTKDTDKWLSWTGTDVMADGKIMHMGYTGKPDGALKAIDKMGDKAGFMPDGKSHWVMADGSTSESDLTVSDDKNTITIESTGKTKDGKETHQKEIYHRVGAKMAAK